MKYSKDQTRHIKQLEAAFLEKVEALTDEYHAEIRKIVKDIEVRKLAEIRVKLKK